MNRVTKSVMASHHKMREDSRPLEILGIGEAEERAYRCLIKNPGIGVREISLLLNISSSKAERLLKRLENIGLLRYSPGKPRRYLPVAPNVSMRSLYHRRQEDMQKVETEIDKLQEDHESALRRGSVEEYTVELLYGYEAVRAAYEHMQMSALEEVVTFVRPPMLIHHLDRHPDQERYFERQAHARGVHYRSIIASDFFDLSHSLQSVQADINAGEEVRLLPDLPFKMILMDRRVALFPLHLEEEDSPCLLIRTSSLLDVLYAFFELLWVRAASVSVNDAGELKPTEHGSGMTEETERLLVLLAAGLNDKRIIAELGIGRRTLERRIATFMSELGAHTRFQLGWLSRELVASSPVEEEDRADRRV